MLKLGGTLVLLLNFYLISFFTPGDTSLPSAAAGIDTYVFEPVRQNSNVLHMSVLANPCQVSEHLTIVNALVSDHDSVNEVV